MSVGRCGRSAGLCAADAAPEPAEGKPPGTPVLLGCPVAGQTPRAPSSERVGAQRVCSVALCGGRVCRVLHPADVGESAPSRGCGGGTFPLELHLSGPSCHTGSGPGRPGLLTACLFAGVSAMLGLPHPPSGVSPGVAVCRAGLTVLLAVTVCPFWYLSPVLPGLGALCHAMTSLGADKSERGPGTSRAWHSVGPFPPQCCVAATRCSPLWT